jgi:dihydroorotase
MRLKRLARKVCLKGGTIYDPYRGKRFTGDLLIVGGKLRSVGGQIKEEGAHTIDCTGLAITPGFCDLHAHFRQPGREDKETLATGSRAALAGGFTRVCVMPNTTPPLDTPEAMGYIVEQGRTCPIHIHPIGAVTKGQKGQELTEMGAMVEAGAVAFSDDGVPIANGAVMRRALEYGSLFGVPIINHAEDPYLRGEGVMNEGPVSTRLGLPGNPSQAEVTMVYRDLTLSRLCRAPLHVPHVTTREAVALIGKFKAQGLKVTAEVTPHHLYFNDEALKTYDTHLKVAPPLRGETHRQALIESVVQGVVDCIATDHAPHTIEEKETTFDEAAFGMIGLESCFGVVNKVLCEENQLPFLDLLKRLTVAPRKIVGLEPDLLRVGQPAELVILDRKREWVFSEGDIHSRSRNSPFVGHTLMGKVVYTVVKGWLGAV